MKHIVIAIVFAMLFGLAAFAQTTPGTQQPSGSNPSMEPPSSPSQSPGMQTSGNQNSARDTKGEKKMKGCIQSESGKYMLQDKHGKEIALGGSADFASHVGHTVTVHGTFAGGPDSGSTATATSSNSGMSAAGGQFIVSKVDMVSETCNGDKGKGKDYDNSGKPNPNRN